jgi:iron(III) transport system substrate-binding protein
MALAVNKKLITEKKLPMPQDWVDLIKPQYKGYITVAAPTKSRTGFTIFANMNDMFGANFIDNIHQNIFQYNSSGSAAARQVGGGETVIGLSYDTAILQQVKANKDVTMVIGRMSPNIIEGAGLIAGASHEAEGKIFLDWLFSKGGMKALEPHVGVGAAPGYGKIDFGNPLVIGKDMPVLAGVLYTGLPSSSTHPFSSVRWCAYGPGFYIYTPSLYLGRSGPWFCIRICRH